MDGRMDRMNKRAECLGSLGQQCADSWTKGSSFPTQWGWNFSLSHIGANKQFWILVTRLFMFFFFFLHFYGSALMSLNVFVRINYGQNCTLLQKLSHGFGQICNQLAGLRAVCQSCWMTFLSDSLFSFWSGINHHIFRRKCFGKRVLLTSHLCTPRLKDGKQQDGERSSGWIRKRFRGFGEYKIQHTMGTLTHILPCTVETDWL